jgi:hypothetical protein
MYETLITIGSSNTSEKIIILDRSYDKNSILFLQSHNYTDKFTYTIENNVLKIKRIDLNQGWMYNHIGYIYENNGTFQYDIGICLDNYYKEIPLNGYYPEDCTLVFENNPHSDTFHCSFQNNILKVVRIDKQEPWAHPHICKVYKNNIPKIIFQTHHSDIPDYVKEKIKEKSPEWNYQFFKDNDIIHFFQSHPLPEFPDIIHKFYSMKRGEHKSDLFRYYFLYIHGGVFLDSDAMIEKNINNLVLSYDFFTVIGIDESMYFNGFIGSVPRNKIIYQALQDAYYINQNDLMKDYFLLIRNLKRIVDNNKSYFNIKLYKEKGNWTGVMPTVDESNHDEIILRHYYDSKIIPR